MSLLVSLGQLTSSTIAHASSRLHITCTEVSLQLKTQKQRMKVFIERMREKMGLWVTGKEREQDKSQSQRKRRRGGHTEYIQKLFVFIALLFFHDSLSNITTCFPAVISHQVPAPFLTSVLKPLFYLTAHSRWRSLASP